MKDQRILLALAAGSLLVLSGAAPPHDFQHCTRSPFKGITETSVEGEILGEPDAADWGCLGDRGPHASEPAAPNAAQDPGGLTAPPPPPLSLCFGPAFPNPAVEFTRLRITLPAEATVSLIVYGQHWRHERHETFPVRVLIDGRFQPGLHEATWDLADEHDTRVPPGTYRAVLVVGGDALCGDIEVR
jgi:hypothetical protein